MDEGEQVLTVALNDVVVDRTLSDQVRGIDNDMNGVADVCLCVCSCVL